MNQSFEQASTIIKEAAKSPLGAISLMVFTSSSIAFYFFSQSSEYIKFGAFIALLIAFCMFTIAIIERKIYRLSPRTKYEENKVEEESIDLKTPPNNLKQKTGNLYWIANDIRYTIDAIAFDQSKENIIEGIKQIRHHAKQLEISQLGDGGHGKWWEDTKFWLQRPLNNEEDFFPVTQAVVLENIDNRLLRIRSEVETTHDNEFKKKKRKWAEQLEEVSLLIGRIATIEQPGFIPKAN